MHIITNIAYHNVGTIAHIYLGCVSLESVHNKEFRKICDKIAWHCIFLLERKIQRGGISKWTNGHWQWLEESQVTKTWRMQVKPTVNNQSEHDINTLPGKLWIHKFTESRNAFTALLSNTLIQRQQVIFMQKKIISTASCCFLFLR